MPTCELPFLLTFAMRASQEQPLEMCTARSVRGRGLRFLSRSFSVRLSSSIEEPPVFLTLFTSILFVLGLLTGHRSVSRISASGCFRSHVEAGEIFELLMLVAQKLPLCPCRGKNFRTTTNPYRCRVAPVAAVHVFVVPLFSGWRVPAPYGGTAAVPGMLLCCQCSRCNTPPSPV